MVETEMVSDEANRRKIPPIPPTQSTEWTDEEEEVRKVDSGRHRSGKQYAQLAGCQRDGGREWGFGWTRSRLLRVKEKVGLGEINMPSQQRASSAGRRLCTRLQGLAGRAASLNFCEFRFHLGNIV